MAVEDEASRLQNRDDGDDDDDEVNTRSIQFGASAMHLPKVQLLPPHRPDCQGFQVNMHLLPSFPAFGAPWLPFHDLISMCEL